HAALTGEVAVGSGTVGPDEDYKVDDPGTVSYYVPHVRSGVFAEARVLFPQDWLGAATMRKEARLDHVLAEEEAWANEANARSESDTLWCNIKIRVLNVLSAGGLLAGIAGLVAHKRKTRSTFADKYYRDVPTDDHPAVLARLLDGKPGNPSALTATLMRLADQRVLSLEQVTTTTKGFLGKEKTEDDYLLTLDQERADEVEDPIDRAALEFLFDYVAVRANEIGSAHGSDEGLLFSDVRRVASHDEDRYLRHLNEWQDAVEQAYYKRGYTQKNAMGSVLSTAGGVGVALAILAFVDLGLLSTDAFGRSDLGIPFVLSAVALAVAGVVVIKIASRMRDLSPEAIEVLAKLKALKRWLKDFTN
ncbi:MAG: DUF2207 domain-containing protein, partial [Atopobiaceae bacterium]|nr:DUF2207 domain-containing protein [Atopobiaceae bacterium]